MARRIDRLCLSAVALLLLGACGFEAPAPVRTPPPPTPAIPLSTLSATLSVTTGELARLLNEKTANRIADIRDKPAKCGIGRCRLSLHAERTGPITVGAQGGQLVVGLPFALNADMQLNGSLSFLSGQANADGFAQAATSAALGSDWQVRTRTSGHIELHNSHLRLGPLLMNVTDILGDASDLFSPELFRMLDKTLSDSLREKPRVAKFWARAFTPIRIGKKPTAWLLLSPERIRVGHIAIAGDAVTVPLGVDVRARVLAAETPPAAEPKPLPPPSPLEEASNRFTFAVPFLLPYTQASRLALAALAGKPPRIAGAKVRFTRIDILPSGADVVVAAAFCADQDWDLFHWFSACGSGYFRGTPRYDAASQTIRIDNVRYDLATANMVLGAVRYLAGPELGRALQQRLVFKVANDVARLQNQIRTAIARPQGRDVVIFGTVDGFGPMALTWTNDGFLAAFSATGAVHASVRL
ncbi:MAG TPA: DUF4403 family protein [Rhizomicrobium sp.]|nr:DUF4403 family protein [Rhizomicrobium sp.]